MEEVTLMKKIDLYEEVEVAECWQRTGRAPTSVKWVDTDKGSGGCTDVRSRLVARDFKPKGEKDRADLFAAMPPLESKKILFRKAASGEQVWRRGAWRRTRLCSSTSRRPT